MSFGVNHDWLVGSLWFLVGNSEWAGSELWVVGCGWLVVGGGWWAVGGGWELVEHFVIGPDTDTSWSRCSNHQSREWHRLRVGEVNLPTIVTTPQQKATTSCRSHKAPSPHITDVKTAPGRPPILKRKY